MTEGAAPAGTSADEAAAAGGQDASFLGPLVVGVVIGAVADLWGWQWAFALSGLVSARAIIPWSRARETLAASAG
mgnify:CR=1 FL=1